MGLHCCLTNARIKRAQKAGPKRLTSLGPLPFPDEGNDMRDATWRRTGLPFGHADHNRGHRKTRSLSRSEALRIFGSVVYAARLADGTIKIGWTEDFENRIRYLASATKQDVELLAFRAGTYEDEQAIHHSLAAHRIEGKREFYYPTAEVLRVVNDMRTALNMPPVAA